MNLRALKRHHWIAIEPGWNCCGHFKNVSREQEQIGGEGYVTQRQFEDAVCAPPVGGKPFVIGMVIHPGSLSMSFTFRGLNISSGVYYDYSFAAPHPYTPIAPVEPARPNDTIRDYLNEVAAIHPDVSFKYAWWEAWWANLSMYGVIGSILIGGIWPTFFKRAGGSESKGPEYDLSRFAQGASQSNSSNSKHHEEIQALQTSASAEPAISGGKRDRRIHSQTAAPELATAPVEPLTAPAAPTKDYAGEYYPVEKHTMHGFTLVEVIVVIGIISVLFSFLMPTLRLVRLNAQTVQCANQLRQIGFAMHAYAGDNHGWLPAWSGWHTWPPEQIGDSYGPAWTIELIPYIGAPDSPVYNCPSFKREGKYRNYFLEAQWAGLSHRQAMKLSDVTMSSRFVLSGDKTNLSFYPPNPAGDDADPDDWGAGMLLWPWTGGIYMHWRGNNVLFDDGHVALFAGYDKDQMTFHPRRMLDYENVTAD